MVSGKGKNSLPLIVLNLLGDVIDLLYTNNKGYKKSIETGRLWCLFEETGRLLPYILHNTLQKETPRLKSITNRGRWLEAVIETDMSTSTITDTATDTITDKVTAIGTGSPHKKALSESIVSTAGTSKTRKNYRNADTINKLISIIHQRRKNMPEGSYTTYLFKEGPDKIKKKLGEEAIELLISKDRSNTVYETADLLYHLLVFLESESIEFKEVLKELKSRMDKE